MKMLTGKLLPDTENEFFELLKIFFPTIYDVKYLMKSCKNLKGGLEEVAKQLEVISYVHFWPIVVLFAFILD
jgi:CCR4-NOT transcription complex subunit 7/8